MATRAFTLLEILVAVSLMTVIMLGLLAMFYQTQRAVHLGTTQTDVLETGRSIMQQITSDVEQACLTPDPYMLQMASDNAPFAPLVQPLPGGDNRVNAMQDFFFITRVNDEWIAKGFFVETPVGGVGTLYCWTSNYLTGTYQTAYRDFRDAINKYFPVGSHRIGDRVMQFSVTPDTNAWVVLAPNGTFATSNRLPNAVEIELAVLEPKTHDKFRTLTNNPTKALEYLQQQVARVHVFRQRIPIHSGL